MRAWFVKRVVVIGAESTGKTTLARQLAEHFDTVWVPEFGREHWERKIAGLRVTDPPPSWSSDEFVEIATEQQRRENAAARVANRVLFCDTNAFATCASNVAQRRSGIRPYASTRSRSDR